ncbi:shikimate kinase [Chloroflexota bacterium]
MKKSSIALIGFMGVGKTAVGRKLAERLDKEFIELDDLIERRAGKTISTIFQKEGEEAFRELEIGVVKEVSGRKSVVIACGGGVVLNKINIDRLKKECLIVYLTASPEVVLKRTAADKTQRPLLEVADKTLTVKELLYFRKPFYEQAADIIIDTSKLDVGSVTEQIIDKVKENESFT